MENEIEILKAENAALTRQLSQPHMEINRLHVSIAYNGLLALDGDVQAKENLKENVLRVAKIYRINIKDVPRVGTFKTAYMDFLKNESGYNTTVHKLLKWL